MIALRKSLGFAVPPAGALVAAALLGLAGCGGDTDVRNIDLTRPAETRDALDVSAPDAPARDAAAGQADVPDGEACPACLRPGLTFRITLLEVTAPSESTPLREYLTVLWGADLCAHRLNLLLHVEEVTPLVDGTTWLTVRAGSGWHAVTEDDGATLRATRVDEVLHPALCDPERDPPTTVPSVYCFEREPAEFVLVVDGDCRFHTDLGARLSIQPGRQDAPFFCAPGDPAIGLPTDTLPLDELVVTGRFSPDCRSVAEGGESVLSGCATRRSLCQLCIPTLAPDYTGAVRAPDETVIPVECAPSTCQRFCGPSPWLNLGHALGGSDPAGGGGAWRVPLSCEVDALPGYRLAGRWAAESVVFAGDCPSAR